MGHNIERAERVHNDSLLVVMGNHPSMRLDFRERGRASAGYPNREFPKTDRELAKAECRRELVRGFNAG